MVSCLGRLVTRTGPAGRRVARALRRPHGGTGCDARDVRRRLAMCRHLPLRRHDRGGRGEGVRRPAPALLGNRRAATDDRARTGAGDRNLGAAHAGDPGRHHADPDAESGVGRPHGRGRGPRQRHRRAAGPRVLPLAVVVVGARWTAPTPGSVAARSFIDPSGRFVLLDPATGAFRALLSARWPTN